MPRLELLEVEAVPGPAGKALEGDDARQPGHPERPVAEVGGARVRGDAREVERRETFAQEVEEARPPDDAAVLAIPQVSGAEGAIALWPAGFERPERLVEREVLAASSGISRSTSSVART